MRNDTILREAAFDPKVKTYWLLSGALVMVFTVVFIPLVPLWFLVGMAFTGRFLASLSCVLTERTLQIKRGVFFRVEKTVPLEKITDLGQHEGPIMRWLNLKGLSVETAGQSGPGALVRMVGIVDTDGFRDAVLDQRDVLGGSRAGAESTPDKLASVSDAPVLTQIRDTLLRIEEHLTRGEG